MTFSENGKLKSVTLVKFRDNVHFNMDSEAFRTVLREKYNEGKDITGFKVRAKFVHISTGRIEYDDVLLLFSGFFKQTLEGKVWTPEGIKPADYDKYIRSSAYLVEFNYDELKVFNPTRMETFKTNLESV